MDTRAVRRGDKEVIEGLRRQFNHYTSSHAFVSLYIWQQEYGLSLYLAEELFAIKCSAKGDNTWFFPCGSDSAKIKFINELDKKNLFFCYMREEDVDFLNKNFANAYVITESRDDSEYIYDRNGWENLKGSTYAKIRNHISRVERDNELYVELITKNNLHNVKKIIDDWDKDTDNYADGILVKNWESLVTTGIVVYVNEVPYAVVAGFPLSEKSFDMCLAKQTGKLSGLSIYAKQQFIKNLPMQYQYINAEEDLGIEGLRIMKEQMKPVDMIKMYNGRITVNE